MVAALRALCPHPGMALAAFQGDAMEQPPQLDVTPYTPPATIRASITAWAAWCHRQPYFAHAYAAGHAEINRLLDELVGR